MHPFLHLKTITKHHFIVMFLCFRVGLIYQGFFHDLSKLSITEFRAGIKYFTGTRSPNVAERQEKGYSTAWMHHKGRNKHHFEYWTDLDQKTRKYVPFPMPRKYLVEMVMDRIAACKTYEGKNYTPASPLNYFNRSHDYELMHEQTYRELKAILEMLEQTGEKQTFKYIKSHVLKGLDI